MSLYRPARLGPRSGLPNTRDWSDILNAALSRMVTTRSGTHGGAPKRRRLTRRHDAKGNAHTPRPSIRVESPFEQLEARVPESFLVALKAGIMQDLSKVLPEDLADYSTFETAHAALRTHALFQMLDALRDDPDLTVHAAAESVAARYANLFCARTLRMWHQDFRENNGQFSMHGRGKWMREILILEEDLHLKLKRWLVGRVKKEDLSVDLALTFINVSLLKPLWWETDGSENAEGRQLLEEYRIGETISRATAHRWMLACGCKYDYVKLCYFQDKHQDPIVVEDRKAYVEVGALLRAFLILA
jgi:hypothetical protein